MPNVNHQMSERVCCKFILPMGINKQNENYLNLPVENYPFNLNYELKPYNFYSAQPCC